MTYLELERAVDKIEEHISLVELGGRLNNILSKEIIAETLKTINESGTLLEYLDLENEVMGELPELRMLTFLRALTPRDLFSVVEYARKK